MTSLLPPSPDFRAALGALPIFPLPHVVLFPGARMPLHIFEPRYREMTRDVLAGARAMALVQIVSGPSAGAVDAHGNPPIARIASIGVVVESEELPDGRFNILLEGKVRASLDELPFVGPYRRARAEPLEEPHTHVPANDLASLLAVASAFTTLVRKREPEFGFVVPTEMSPPRIADLCAHHLVLDPHERQKLLETLDPLERVRALASTLAGQLTLFRHEPSGKLN